MQGMQLNANTITANMRAKNFIKCKYRNNLVNDEHCKIAGSARDNYKTSLRLTKTTNSPSQIPANVGFQSEDTSVPPFRGKA